MGDSQSLSAYSVGSVIVHYTVPTGRPFVQVIVARALWQERQVGRLTPSSGSPNRSVIGENGCQSQGSALHAGTRHTRMHHIGEQQPNKVNYIHHAHLRCRPHNPVTLTCQAPTDPPCSTNTQLPAKGIHGFKPGHRPTQARSRVLPAPAPLLPQHQSGGGARRASCRRASKSHPQAHPQAHPAPRSPLAA